LELQPGTGVGTVIHPTAVVSPEARLGTDVHVGAHAVVEAGAEIGDGCRLHEHTIVRGGSTLGAEVTVHAFAVVGGPPQDLKFDANTPSSVRVGARTVLREGVTLNRSTKPGGCTLVGQDCFLMAYSHVAHDCLLEEHVILANCVLLAGHCQVGAHAFLGGGAGVHQFTRIGEGAMIGGVSPISLDIPPYLLVADRNRISGLNVVGLRRRGATSDTLAELKDAFHRVYRTGNPREHAAALLASASVRSLEARRFLEFFADSRRGIARPRSA
jgi:UDP-N-acetylglucosamine acyltransferase